MLRLETFEYHKISLLNFIADFFTHIAQIFDERQRNVPKAVHGGDAKPLVEQDTSTPLVCHHKMYHELPGESVGFRIAPAHYP